MSKEDLLKDRYKVIADFPGNEWKVGTILFKNEKTFRGNGFNEDYKLEYYPHLFKKLSWWEERDLKDLPKYVKNNDGEVFKVKRWNLELASILTAFINPSIHKGYVKDCTQCPIYEDVLPATKEEYESYLKQKQ